MPPYDPVVIFTVLRSACYLILAFFMSWVATRNRDTRHALLFVSCVFVFTAVVSLSTLGVWFAFEVAQFILTPFVVIATVLAITAVYKGSREKR